MINWRKPTIFALLYLSGSKIPRNLKIIQKLAKSSKREIKKYQEEKLKKILLHAYKNVPYYHQVLAESGVITKSGKVDLKKFFNIPTLTKDIIRKEGKNLHSSDYKRRGHYKNTSGGSTGEPVVFIQDKEYEDVNVIANKIYFNRMLGKEPGEREINLWGSDRDIKRNSQGFKNDLINILYNRRFLNAFELSDKKLDHFIKIINAFKPISIWSYVESLDEISKYVEEKNMRMYSPKFIITTAGTLYPEMKERAQRVFNCPIINQYGSREVGPIAIQCLQRVGLHVFPWSHYLEIIDGEVVVTCLTNFSMPLIRYKIGDEATKSKKVTCKCGTPTLFFKDIKGRTISHFIKETGEKIHGQYFIHLFYYRDWVKKFQIVQNEINQIECKIVGKKNGFEMYKISRNIKRIMGNNCQVKFCFLKEIRPLDNGKFIYTICKLDHKK